MNSNRNFFKSFNKRMNWSVLAIALALTIGLSVWAVAEKASQYKQAEAAKLEAQILDLKAQGKVPSADLVTRYEQSMSDANSVTVISIDAANPGANNLSSPLTPLTNNVSNGQSFASSNPLKDEISQLDQKAASLGLTEAEKAHYNQVWWELYNQPSQYSLYKANASDGNGSQVAPLSPHDENILVMRQELSRLQGEINDAAYSGHTPDANKVARFKDLYFQVYGNLEGQIGEVLTEAVPGTEVASSPEISPIENENNTDLAPVSIDYAALRLERDELVTRIAEERQASNGQLTQSLEALDVRLGEVEHILFYRDNPDFDRNRNPLDQGSEICAGATVIPTAASVSYCASGFMGTTQDCALGTLSVFKDVFYQFTPTTTGIYAISMCGSIGNTRFNIWATTCCSGSSFTSDDDSCGGSDPTRRVTLTAGTNYFIQCGYSTSAQIADAYFFNLSGPLSGVPANDACAGATNIPSVPATVSGTIFGATTDPTSPSCGGTSVNNFAVWYTVTGNGNEYTAGVYNNCSTFDSRVRVYSGTCASLVCVGGNDDYPTSSGLSQTQWCTTNGTVYYIIVSSFFSSANYRGPFTLIVRDIGPCVPANDLCASAANVAIPSSTTGQTLTATTESPLPPTCNAITVSSAGVWYTLLGNGNTLTASTCNSYTDFDTKIHVYTGTCGTWTCVGANDNATPTCTFGSTRSSFSWCALSGTPYYILVSGSSGVGPSIGLFQLDISNGANCSSPDLAVSALAPCGTQGPNGTAAVTFTVTNIGGGASAATTARFNFDSGVTIDAVAIAGLAPSASVNVTTFTNTINLTLGAHTLVGSVDAVAGEVVTANNSANCNITVVRPCASCTPTDFNLDPVPTTVYTGLVSGNLGNGGKWVGSFTGIAGVPYHFDLCSTLPGSGNANFDIDINIRDASCVFLAYDDGPSACSFHSQDFVWTPPTTGTYYLNLGHFNFGTTTLNCASGVIGDTFTLNYYREDPHPDLALSNLTPCGTQTAGSYPVSVRVTNTGSVNSAATTARFSFDNGVTIDNAPVGILAPSSFFDVFFSVPVNITVGSHTLRSWVDTQALDPATNDTATCGISTPNDLCADAIPVAVPSVTNGTTVGATIDTPLPTGTPFCNSSNDTTYTAGGVWYTVVGNDSVIFANTCAATGFDSKISVFSGNCGSLAYIAGDDDACSPNTCSFSGLRSYVSWCSDLGVTYHILVHGFSTNTGAFVLNTGSLNRCHVDCDTVLVCGAPAETEPNNTCATFDAKQLGCTDSVFAKHCQVSDLDFFKVTVPAQTTLTLTLYDGAGCTTSPTTQVQGRIFNSACASPSATFTGPVAASNCGLTPVDVYLEVSGIASNISAYKVVTSCVNAAVANDLCANATPVAIPSTTPGSTGGCATNDLQSLCGSNAGVTQTAAGVWYTVIGNDHTLTANTCDAVGFDTQLSVYTGVCGTLTCIAGNDDDATCASSGVRSKVTWCSDAGVTYYILVHGFSTNVGNFVLNVLDGPCCHLRVHNQTQLTDYCNISSAVAVANPGDVILADAYTYNENVVINIPLTLNGPNANVDPRGLCAISGPRVAEAIIDGGGLGNTIQILANGVTVNGFTIKGGSSGLGAAGVWVSAASSGVNLLYNILTDNEIGVYANGGPASNIQHSLFDANNRPGPAGGTGIYSENTNGFTIDDNEFKNHTVNNPVIFGATSAGVHVNLGFIGNYVHDNISGVYAIGITNGYFIANILEAPAATGLTLAGACVGVEVTRTIFRNSDRGLRIRDDGYGYGDNSGGFAHNNSFTGLADFSVGVLSGYTGTYDASLNWWDTNSPVVVPTKLNTSGGSIDYTPWLDAGTNLTPTCIGFSGDFHGLWVDDDSPQTGADNRIQEAVNNVVGSTIWLAPGTYAGQVVISAFPSTLNIIGTGALPGDVLIQGVASMPHQFLAGRVAVIAVENTNTVNFSNLTIDGDGQGNSNTQYYGVAFFKSGGSLSTVNVVHVRNTPIDGVQSGVGVWAWNQDVGTYTLNLTDVNISDFQKNGTALSGVGLTVNLVNTNVTGAGPVGFIAQNGVQISFGAGGTVTGGSVNGIAYTGGPSYASGGYLIYLSSGVNISGTASNGNQIGVWFTNSDGSVTNSTVNGASVGVYDTGVEIDNFFGASSTTRQTRPAPSVIADGSQKRDYRNRNLDANQTVTVSNTPLNGTNQAGSAGIYVYGAQDVTTVNALTNDINNWDYGIYFDEDATGAIVGLVDANDIHSNGTNGLVNDSGSLTVTNNRFANSPASNATDPQTGNTYNLNCWSDFGTNALFPADYLVDGGAGNTDFNPNPNVCASIDIIPVGGSVGCNAACYGDTLYLTFDQVGYITGQLFIQIPPQLAANWAGVLNSFPGSNVATNLNFSQANNLGGGLVEVNVAWAPPYSDGNGSKYIACLPIVGNGGPSGTYVVTGYTGPFFDINGPHTGFILGSTTITIDCDAPVASLTYNTPACGAVGSGAQLVGLFDGSGIRGGAPNSPIVAAYLEVNGNPLQQVYLLNTEIGGDYNFTGEANLANSNTLFGFLNEGCNNVVLHVVDKACNNGPSAAVVVGKDTTPPGLTVVNNDLSRCYNNVPTSPNNYGGNKLDDDIDISTALNAALCTAQTGTLTITYLGGLPYTVGALDVALYPVNDAEALALWTWILTQVPGTANGESYTFDVHASDCAGNVTTVSFSICIDLTAPANTLTYFDARPTDEGVWLKWTWNYNATQAVQMQVWRSPDSGLYPNYATNLWSNLANPANYPTTFPPAGWTLVANQVGPTSTSTAFAGLNGKGNNLHSGPGAAYWKDEDASWVDESEDRDIYRYVTFVKDAGGNWSSVASYTLNVNGDRSTNYWLGDYTRDVTLDPNGSSGFVNTADLSLLSSVYFTTVPSTPGYYNVGPENTENGIGKGIPSPDGFVNYLDLVPFSFNFGTTAPNSFNVNTPNTPAFENLDAQPAITLVRTSQTAINPGDEFSVVVSLSGNNEHSVKVLETEISFSTQVLELVSITNNDVQVMDGIPFVTAKEVAGQNGRLVVAAAALGEIATIGTDGAIATITFRWKETDATGTQIAITSSHLADGFGNYITGSSSILAIGAGEVMPTEFALHQNYPNPFNPNTQIRFDLAEASNVRLVIFNLLGQEVKTLVDGSLPAGAHHVMWDGTNNASEGVSSGLYIYSIKAGNFSSTKKMLFAR